MPDHKSEIDSAVLEHRKNMQHQYDTIEVEDEGKVSFCIKCGTRYTDVAAADPPLPCRGFIR